ncbi:SCO6880 family protein [Nocardioides sp. NPDC051685]|uniref:SCO6880 family protein n=1 Tax=Nocardioides sp. NPDC051685 TaxID=3364334 RepID=UPI0037A97D6F
MTISPAPYELAPVKFSRLAKRGLFLGLSLGQVVVLGIGVITLLLALYTAGGIGVVVASPVLMTCSVLAWSSVGGRRIVAWLPISSVWLWRTATRQREFRCRISRPRPAGTLALPGGAACLRQWVDEETGAVMVHDPHAATLTAIISVTHPAFMLLDPAEQQRRVTGWGRVLASTCRSGRIAGLQVLERTLPDSGKGLAEWWKTHGTHDESWASRTYDELIASAGPAGERHATTISISLDLKTARRAIHAAGGGMRGSATVLRQEMTTLTAALRAADLVPGGWLTPGDLALVLRTAYDPGITAALECHPTLGRDLTTAGPIAVSESWGSFQSDSAHHAVLWISEWPRYQVYPGFLAPLLLTSGVRRSISLRYTPIRADVAARDLRRKKTEYVSDAAQRRRIGQLDDAQQNAEYADVLQQEADLTSGHGVLRVTGFVTLSASTANDLERDVAAVEQAAIQASCETRRLWGQQSQAFAGVSLPLCRTPP